MLRNIRLTMRFTLLIGLWLLARTVVSNAQTDTTFWFVAPEVASGHSDRPVGFRVTSQGQVSQVTISMPSNPAFAPVTWTVPANGTRTVIYSDNDTLDLIENKSHNLVHNKGFLITATTPITAYYEVISANNNPDIFALKGRNALGTNFLVPSQNEMGNEHGHERIDIVATEDNTTIQIIPTANLQGTNMDTVNITLQQGQTYSVRASSQTANVSLRGTQIRSNRKIAVTITDDSVLGGTIYGGGCYDLLGDQLIPTNIIGQEYIAIRGFLSLNGGQIREKVYILATEDNTSISINGVFQTTLQARQTFVDTFTTNEIYISATKPVYVMHISGFGCETGMAILPPIACTGSTQVGFTRTTNEFFGLYIFTEAGNQGGFTLNNDANLIQAGDFSVVPGTAGAWLYTRKNFITTDTISRGSGNLVANNLGKFHMGIINGGASTGCRYGFFSDFARYVIETSTNSTAEDPICEGDTLRVWADSIIGATQYTWVTPQGLINAREIVIPAMTAADTGLYWAFAIVDGCRSEDDTLFVGMKPLPGNPNIGNTGPYCVGDTIQLTADSLAGVSYLWSGPNGFSRNQRNPVITAASLSDSGTYTLQLTLNGCVGELYQTQVIVHPIPAQPVSGAIDSALCPGDTLFLTADSVQGATYAWTGPGGFSGASRNPVITNFTGAKAGLYQVTVTKNGCTSTPDSVTVSILPGPLAVAVLSGSLTSCNGDTTVLRIAPAFGNSYQWFRNGVAIRPGGVNDTLLTVTSSGTYQIEATSVFGCSDTSNSVVVFVRPPANTTISPSINPPIICQGDSIALRVASGPGYAYAWQRNGIPVPGASDSVLFTLQDGFYTVTITDSANCPTSSLTATQVQLVQPPIAGIIPAGTVNFCLNSEVTLRANADTLASYQWLRNNQVIAAATDSIYLADTAGAYSVIMRYASGCFDTSVATTLQFHPQPVATLSFSGDSIRCTEDSVRLAGPSIAGLSYRWFRNNIIIAGANDSVLFARTSGNYQLVVENVQGCTDSSAILPFIFQSPAAPVRIGAASRLFCEGDSILLQVQRQSAGTLQWFRNGVNLGVSATDSFLQIGQNGQYVVQTTDSIGCASFGDTITVNYHPPVIATLVPNGPTTFCRGGQLTLQAQPANATTYAWLRNGILMAGVSTASIVSDTTGNYQVIITNATGCVDTSATTTLQFHPQPVATLSFSGDSIRCTEDSVRLAGPSIAGLSYRWFRNNIIIAGANDSVLFARTSGNYQLVVENVQGCTDSSAILPFIFQSPAAPVRIGAASRLFCEGDSILLQVQRQSAGTLQWFRNGVNLGVSATDSFLQIGQNGQYVVQTTDSIGCASFGDTITVNYHPPVIATLVPNGPTTFCSGSQLTLQAQPANAAAYVWFRNDTLLAGLSTSSINASIQGNYRVRITNAAGCFDTSTALEIQLYPLPTVAVSAARQIACIGDTIVLRATQRSDYVYQWLRNGIALAAAQADSFVAQQPGQYAVVVTDSNNCTVVSPALVLQQHPAVITSVSINGPGIFCAGDSTLLQLTPSAGAQYQWTRDGQSLLNDTLPALRVYSSGIYRVFVTSPEGCFDSSLAQNIVVNPLPVAIINPLANDSLCVGDSLLLQAANTAGLSIQWLRNGTVISGQTAAQLFVHQAGAYQLVVTNAQNCPDTSAVTNIRMRPQPLATLILNGPARFCVGESSLLRGPVSSQLIYQWYRNGLLQSANGDSLLVNTSGNYTLRVVDLSGCSDTSAGIQIIVDSLPIADIQPTGVISFCPGSQQVLRVTAQAGASYRWERNGITIAGATGPALTATLPGDYRVFVQFTGTGCLDSSVIITIQHFPEPSISILTNDPTSRCAGETVTLRSNSPDGNLTYQWMRNGNPVTAAVGNDFIALLSGNYQVVVTNLQGCSDTSNIIQVNILNRPSAAAIRPGPFDLCEGDPLLLELPNQANVNYQWFLNNNPIAGAITHQLNVTQSGTYSCAATHQNGCGELSQDIFVQFRVRPPGAQPQANGPVCFGDVIALSANPVPNASCSWRGPANFSAIQTNVVINNASPVNSGWYYCHAVLNGCSSVVDSVFVHVEPAIPQFTIRGKTRLCTGYTLELEVDSFAGAVYNWTSTNGLQATGKRIELENVWLSDSGTYSLDLTVNGCPAPPKSVRVTVNDHSFYFPTAFTPNGDGLNEVFKPATFYEGPYDIRIYDRWGALVFKSDDPKIPWDGTVFGGPGDAGAYNYVLHFEGCVRESEYLSGTVLLLR